MSDSSQVSAQRRARLANRKTLFFQIQNVPEDQVYKYALRTAYIAYVLQPEVQAKLHPRDVTPAQPTRPSIPSKQPSGSSSGFGIMDLIRDSPNSRDPKSNKFPKELVQLLSDKLQNIFMGRDPKYQDQLVRATFGAFFNHFIEPTYFKQVKENRKIEDLVLIFYSKATTELRRRSVGEEWKSLVDQHMVLFIKMILDLMTEHHLATSNPELMAKLQSFEAKLLTEEVLVPEAPPKSTQDNVPEISYSIQDMQLVSIVGQLFSKPQSSVQKDVDHIRVLASEHAAMHDLKSYMKDVNTATPPSLRPVDFPDEISYEEWKLEESKAISQLILSMLESNPLLAQSEPVEVLPSLLSDPTSPDKLDLRRVVSENSSSAGMKGMEVEQLTIATNGKNGRPDIKRQVSTGEEGEVVGRHNYTFIPDDPRAYFRKLIELCLKARRNMEQEEQQDGSLVSPITRLLLNECAVRWRVHPATRIALMLDVVRELYDNQELDIQDINEGFIMADNWNYSSWPTTDRLLLRRVLVTMHETLLRELYNVLQQAFAPKPLNPKPILLILDQYIYSNPLFNETEPDLTKYISDLEVGIRNCAVELYEERRVQFFQEPNLDLIHIHDFAIVFLDDFQRIHKRFREPILGKVDIFFIAVDVFVPLLFKDIHTVLVALIHQAAKNKEELPTDDMFEVYHKIKESWALYKQVVRRDLGFDVEGIFRPALQKWLEVADATCIEWVDRAVRGDTLKPQNDDLKQSTSVMDLFQFIGESVEFLKKLQWPDELQNAKFATRLARSIDKALGHYCMLMEHAFSDEMNAQEDASNHHADDGWMGRIRAAIAGDEKAEPFHFKPQSLVRLNNIQFALRKLDALQNNINVDAMASIIEKNTPKSEKSAEKQSYIFTIKIVSAEDLKPCDINGLSDPYVVLSDEHGRRIAKTRTISKNLNPRWDETFDIVTTGSLWLAATVWDRDKLVKNHDLVGRCYVKLDPNYFGDYLPRDLWLDLDTQGKLLLRVSMEGEKDDIQFYFGRAFRALKRAEKDMTRKIVDTMIAFSRHCLSMGVIRSIVTQTSTQRITSWLGRTNLSKPQGANVAKQQGIQDEEVEKAIHPLFDYFDANFAILDESLSKVSSVIVMGKLWKSVLGMFEDLLLPPLSDKPSRMRQLNEPEVDIIYRWLTFLRNYFFADGDGVPMDVLTSPKYNDILSVRFFYDESTENLIRESRRIAEHAYQQYEGNRASRMIPVAYGQPKSVLKYRSLGTIKAHKAKKRDAKQKEPNDDIILRILRMRPGSEAYLTERFRQKNKLAATAAAEGVLRGPRR